MVSINDVKVVEIGELCATSLPCSHDFTVKLFDGREVRCGFFYSLDIHSVISQLADNKISSVENWTAISQLADNKISSVENWTASDIRKHFDKYSEKRPLFEANRKTAQEVLNKIFTS